MDEGNNKHMAIDKECLNLLKIHSLFQKYSLKCMFFIYLLLLLILMLGLALSNVFLSR